ncbi:hypothetical protein SS50377_24471 [Spironucleus salmonicida]|uniref:Uncharacterized protein n=1 Tax=Spironucleus salmonicida TaxID=348837 RepID=V6LQJ9_9EUKA|nr:hypothetical protein SS50377_24471 [Spironucleus salmonicida]|eukprot:EST45981.1 Hypothetical protein SS50377_13963 [Spironucleus salmonicida]
MSNNQVMKEYVQKLKDYAFSKFELNDFALCERLSSQNQEFWTKFCADNKIPHEKHQLVFKNLQEQIYADKFSTYKLNIRYHVLKTLMETGEILRINALTKEDIETFVSTIAGLFNDIPAFLVKNYTRQMTTKLTEIKDATQLVERLNYEKQTATDKQFPLCLEFLEEYQQFLQALIDFIQIEEEKFEGEEEELQEGDCCDEHCDKDCHGH